MAPLERILDVLCANQIRIFGGLYSPLKKYKVENNSAWTTTYDNYAGANQLFMVSIDPEQQTDSTDGLAYKVQVKY